LRATRVFITKGGQHHEQAKETVWKYHSDNPANIEGYAKLIEELF
jgi:hypothetical protein